MKLISLKISLKIIEKDYKIIKRIAFQIVYNMNENRKEHEHATEDFSRLPIQKETTFDKL